MADAKYYSNGKNKNITLIVCKDYETLSMKAAQIIAAQVNQKPDCVLGLATGSTPIGTYKNLVEAYKNGDLDFSQVKSVNLDEYRGLPRENDQSYYYFMHDNLFKHVNIDLAKVVGQSNRQNLSIISH